MARVDRTPGGKPATPHGSQILLSAFFEQTFLPLKLRHRTPAYADIVRGGIHWLRKALSREPRLADLNAGAIAQTEELLRSVGIGAYRTRDVRKVLLSLWRFAAKLGMAAPYDPSAATRSPRPLPAAFVAKQSDPPKRQLPVEPPAAPNTLRGFFENEHRPQFLQGIGQLHALDYARTLRFLRTCLGREALTSELSDRLAAAFFSWLQTKRDASAGSVNAHRARLFCIWRAAHRAGLVEKLPTVPKLPVNREEPDAWSADEFRRLLVAADACDFPPIDGIPANLFWRAILLTCWYTALRRRSLFSIRPADVDLERGTLVIHGAGIKTRRGKRFSIPPDLAEAIRAVWSADREFLFPHVAKRVRNDFPKLIDGAGIPVGLHRLGQFHRVRRTVATQIAINGGIAAAQSHLDHSTAQMTRRYIDPTQLPDNDATRFLPPLDSVAGSAAAQSGGPVPVVNRPRFIVPPPHPQ